MPNASDRLTAHFTFGELNAHQAPPQYQMNARRLAEYLEVIRSLLGVPIQVTSGWRSVEHNNRVGGSQTSSHLTGDAADIKPLGISQFEAYRIITKAIKAQQLPMWDQIIYYPLQHIHIGLGPANRRQILIRTSEGSYTALVGNLVSKLTGAPDDTPGSSAVVLLALLFVALAIIFSTSA